MQVNLGNLKLPQFLNNHIKFIVCILFIISLLAFVFPSAQAEEAETAPVASKFEPDLTINGILQQGSVEPTVSCPAGYSEVGGPYHGGIMGHHRTIEDTFNIPTDGELLIVGWAMEGHPERGCSPAGAPGEHEWCLQNQQDESFKITLVDQETGSLNEIGTYHDKRDADFSNYWYLAGPFSRNVTASTYQIIFSHYYNNGHSVDFKGYACFKSDTAASTPTPTPNATGFDYGDAPASYGVASHSIKSGVSLGADVDSESASQFSANAAGDDSTGTDDEDGISFISGNTGELGTSKTLQYVARQAAHHDYYLSGWIDWNQNGSFETLEAIIAPIPVYQDPFLQSGSVSFTVPSSAACGTTYARFRFASDPTNPTGNESGGEVEDYQFTVTCSPPTATPTAVPPTPTPSPTPVLVDLAIQTIPDEASVQLSDYVSILTQVQNSGPNPAQDPYVDVTIPLELIGSDDISLTEHNGWDCSRTGTNIRCDRSSFPAYTSWEDVVTIEARIPGTYGADVVDGTGFVDNTLDDSFWLDNSSVYSINIEKSWASAEGSIPSPKLFMHALYSDQLGSLVKSEADYFADDILSNPFQVPVDVTIGMTLDGNEVYLTTEFCSNNPSAPGCHLDTDRIYGTMQLQSYQISDVVEIDLTTSSDLSGNYVTAPVTVTLGLDGFGRYTSIIPSECQDWQTVMGGQGYCVIEVEDIDPLWSNAILDLYEWDTAEYTSLAFYSNGGRDISCPAGTGACISSDDAKPATLRLSGNAKYQIIFHDTLGRIPTTPYIVPNQNTSFDFFIEMVAPFIESN